MTYYGVLDLVDEVLRLYDAEVVMTYSVLKDKLEAVVSKRRMTEDVARLVDDLDVSNKRDG